jgi:hypothetical protein
VDAVRLWPTPKSSPGGPDFARSDRPRRGGSDLATAVALFPTPRASKPEGYAGEGFRPTLAQVATGQERPASGQLNPRWVEWLMGFPDGWTDLGH